MIKPFYEEEFDVREYINKRILEINSLSDRMLYREMTEAFMIELFEKHRQDCMNLVQKVLDEVSQSDTHCDISIGLIELEEVIKMRDKRCTKEEVEKELFSEIERVNQCFKNIEKFTKYVEDKRYKDERDKNDKLSLIDANHSSIIKFKLDIIRYKYTLGAELSELREEYLVLLDQVDKTSYNCGFNDCSVLALGILFEEGIEKFEKLISIMDRVKKHDLMYDYIVNACGLKRKFYSDSFQDDDFEFMKEVIELAQKDKEQASKKLVYHFKTNWNDSTRPYGNWLWDCAAIVKILKLDDSELKDNPHYPYELAHYKNEMEFIPEKMLDFPKESYKKGIPEYPRLEKLIPAKFHEMTNNFFVDFKTLSDEDFCEKYELDWLDPDEYAKQKDDPEVFGTNLIYFLTDSGYILGFEKLDDLEHVDLYKNFWGRRKVKPVRFDLKCDCYYIAYVPKSVKLKSIFGVKIEEVKDLKELDQYQEYLGQFDNE